jgi:glutathione S-transferase
MGFIAHRALYRRRVSGHRLPHPRDQHIVEVLNAYGYKRIVTDIVVRYFFFDKAKGPGMDAIAAAIQDRMLGSDPYLVGRDVTFSDVLLAPIIGAFVQFQEGTRALAKLPKLSHWWLAMQQWPSFARTAPKM